MKRKTIIWVCFAFGLFALVREFWPICPPPLPTWDCETQEINIKTGQARYRRYRFFVKIHDAVEDTVLSKAIAEPVSVTDINEWHIVNQFAPPSFGISPNFFFHGALSQVQEVETLQKVYSLSESNVSSIARQLLIEWQTTGRYSSAGRYLSDKMMELEQQGRGDAQPATQSGQPIP